MLYLFVGNRSENDGLTYTRVVFFSKGTLSVSSDRRRRVPQDLPDL